LPTELPLLEPTARHSFTLLVNDPSARLVPQRKPVEGQVFMPFHFFETNVNEVTQDAFDPISREPNYKQCAVRVQRSQGVT
jgi:predicted molibdopterin-dependent oxidoreductase YjgC